MKIAFILPAVGRKSPKEYVKTWQMEPLAIAVLSALTPSDIDRVFHDDRLETIPYDDPVDLVAMSVETYTSRRAYQIARRYKKRGIPIVLGGFHPTLVPDEAMQHADAIVVGDAEPVWTNLLEDLRNNQLKPCYDGGQSGSLEGIVPDRSIFEDKKYAKLSLVETARGCRYDCEFCSVTSFYDATYRPRPISDVIDELRNLKKRSVFFVDDNFCADRKRLKELIGAIIDADLGIRWFTQVSIDVADDSELLDMLRKSGCICVLIGFESLESETLAKMGKRINDQGKFDAAIQRLRDHGISVYGTFVFGYDGDRRESFDKTLDFAVRNKLFFAAFNHLVPFPGTAIYERLRSEGRVEENWWLSPDYRFGQVAFTPKTLSAEELETFCFAYRQKFYRPLTIAKRGMDLKANCRTPLKAFVFFVYNLLSGKEVHQRQMLPLGVQWEDGDE